MESELSVSYDDLLAEVGFFLGYGGTRAEWSARQLAEVDRYVQSGVRRFYYPPDVDGAETAYPWSFLSPVTTIATVADTETQDMPSDLGRVLGAFHFEADQHRRAVVQVPEDRFRSAKAAGQSSGQPIFAVLRHKPKTPATGHRLEVSWWPVPDAAYTLTYRYEAFAAPLSDENRFPLGGMRHSELLIQSCLAVAEQRANDERGHHTAEFDRLLKSSIAQDRKVGAMSFGFMGDRESRVDLTPHGMTGGTYPITYKGDTL